ncbi:hypothetical protein H9P43_009320 [Blastocladiella emersonii ATCC 22665]|nr:hypothetical protein H9P43_009320 [Blastocladiella emersonii ATCC 22665]
MPPAAGVPDLAITAAQVHDLFLQLEAINRDNEAALAALSREVHSVKESLAARSDLPPTEPRDLSGFAPPPETFDDATAVARELEIDVETAPPSEPAPEHTSTQTSPVPADPLPEAGTQTPSRPPTPPTPPVPVPAASVPAPEPVPAVDHAVQTGEYTDPRIVELQRDNAHLMGTLKEYESTLELIMGKFRAQVQLAQQEKKRIYAECQAQLDAEKRRSETLAEEKVSALSHLETAQAVMRESLRLSAEEHASLLQSISTYDAELATLRSALGTDREQLLLQHRDAAVADANALDAPPAANAMPVTLERIASSPTSPVSPPPPAAAEPAPEPAIPPVQVPPLEDAPVTAAAADDTAGTGFASTDPTFVTISRRPAAAEGEGGPEQVAAVDPVAPPPEVDVDAEVTTL